jgi:hypothetical protein
MVVAVAVAHGGGVEVTAATAGPGGTEGPSDTGTSYSCERARGSPLRPTPVDACEAATDLLARIGDLACEYGPADR